ncbi:MAG: mucoidy inhibitor MuiA family protein [Rhodothermales bacterium]
MTLSLLLATFFLIQTSSQANEQDIAAQITQVTVFQRGAQVTREASLDVPEGTTRLTFTGLAPGLDPESIQLNASGAVTVLSVVHRTNYLEDVGPSAEAMALQTARQAIRDSLKAEEMLLDVYEKEEALLLANTSIGGTTTGVEVAELRAAADFFRARLTEIKERQRAISKTMERLRERLTEIEGQLSEIAANRPRRTTSEVDITLTAAAPTRSALTLRYLAPNAGWTPRYDLRVADVDQPIAFAYNANVTQQSGEDWTDVRLTLSTGDPSQPGTIPNLMPWRLGFYRPPSAQAARRGRPSRAIPGAPVANPRAVSGRVTELSTGEPIPGVNVVVVGTSTGATADAQGFYQIDLPPNAQRLRAAFIGYQSIETPISSNRIDFVLADEVVALSEVVVTSDRALRTQNMDAAVEEEEAASLPVPVQQVTRATTVEFAIESPTRSLRTASRTRCRSKTTRCRQPTATTPRPSWPKPPT